MPPTLDRPPGPAPTGTPAAGRGAYLSLLLADGRLPVGAHTQSAGVEPAFAAGMTLADVPRYLQVRLRTVTEVEAGLAVLARRAWTSLADPDERLARLADLDDGWRARTVSDALRDASDLLARSYLRTAARVLDLALLEHGRPGSPRRTWCRGVVVGATAAAAGLSAAETARVVAFDEVQTVLAAALKLVPFDPTQSVRWAVEAADEVEALVARVAPLTDPADLPAHSAPLIEQWGQHHRDTERRLFRA